MSDIIPQDVSQDVQGVTHATKQDVSQLTEHVTDTVNQAVADGTTATKNFFHSAIVHLYVVGGIAGVAGFGMGFLIGHFG